MGNLALGQMTQYFKEWPSLDYFYNTQARNGGPIGKFILCFASSRLMVFKFYSFTNERRHPDRWLIRKPEEQGVYL